MQVFDMLGNHRLLNTHILDIMLIGRGCLHGGCSQGHLSLPLNRGGKVFSRSE